MTCLSYVPHRAHSVQEALLLQLFSRCRYCATGTFATFVFALQRLVLVLVFGVSWL